MFDTEGTLEAVHDLHNRLGEVLVNDWFRHQPRMLLFFSAVIILAWGVDAVVMWKDPKGLAIVSTIFVFGMVAATMTS